MRCATESETESGPTDGYRLPHMSRPADRRPAARIYDCRRQFCRCQTESGRRERRQTEVRDRDIAATPLSWLSPRTFAASRGCTSNPSVGIESADIAVELKSLSYF